MTSTDALDSGRQSFRRQAWAAAHRQLSAADRTRALEPDDLERLATAAYLAGRLSDSVDAWARAHQERLRDGAVEEAARCAFWLAFELLAAGERARGGAWLARARGLLDEMNTDCVVHGYLLLPAARQRIGEGDAAGAYALFSEAADLAERFADRNLLALARHSRGRALIRMGRIPQGVACLDEAMVAVDAGDVSPLVVGDVYCSVIEGCFEIFDLRRAQEWTAALTRWCEAQPELVPYSGQCLVRRAEILQLRGAWPEAGDAARRACTRFLKTPHEAAAGAAFYQVAELSRLRGEFEQAEDAYREASRRGRSLQPGLALLRWAQGQVKAADIAIRRALEDAGPSVARGSLLPAHVDILLAAGDVAAARASAGELARMAERLDATLPRAVADQAHGAVLLADGDPQAALGALRSAWKGYQEVEAPYHAARVRVLIGLASRKLGDRDAAAMEFDAARWVFQQLQAGPDVARVDDLSREAELTATRPALSARELEVLRLVAAGGTNRAIALELLISERTVERHLSNIYAKLNLASRAAATAYAYEHRLV